MANTIGYGQGAVNNTNSWGQGAKVGSSFSNTQSVNLDGVDDVIIGATSGNIIQGNKTVSWWMKLDNYARNEMVLSISTGSAADHFSVRHLTSGSIAVGARGAAVHGIAANTSLYDVTTLENWTHILVTKRTRYIEKIFINGVDVTGNNVTVNAGTDNQIKIGQIGNIGYYGGLLQGNIDELAVFDGKLDSSEQVASIYNNGVPNDLTDLNPLLWYRFEGTGTTATDSGSGGNNGTLTNGVTRSSDVPT